MLTSSWSYLFCSYSKNRRIVSFFVFCLLASWTIQISLHSPVTFDEAFYWNYYRYSTLFNIIGDFSVSWGNQVPFTLLQSKISPEMISLSPWFIRLISTTIGITLMGLVIFQSTKTSSRVFLPVLIIIGSPMIFSYLFIARSYSLTALLCVVTFFTTSRFPTTNKQTFARLLAGVVPLAIAIWALPTLVFIVPSFLFFQFLRRGFAQFLIQFLFLTLLIVISFASKFTKMLKLAHNNPWTGSPSFTDYANNFSFQWLLTGVAFCLILSPFLVHARQFLREPLSFKQYVSSLSARNFVAIATICTGLSYFFITYFAYLFGMEWPFARNAVGPLWLVITGISMLPTIPHTRAKLIYPLLTATAIIGLSSLTSGLNNGDWQRINPVLTQTVPATIRDLQGNGVTHIICSMYDAPVCTLSIGLLQSQNITMQQGDELIPNLSCVIGTHKPPPEWQVRLYKGDKLWGQLCH